MHLSVVVGDITALDVDAIVNAANETLLRGGGVCGAIFRAAGPQLEEACAAVAPCPTGQARVTPGFNAKARWIIHAVGPVWQGGGANEAGLLASAYRESLRLARTADAESISFSRDLDGHFRLPQTAGCRNSSARRESVVRTVVVAGAYRVLLFYAR